MLSVLGFLVALMPLVVFHEFGHFIFARIFGVKAETFSVGFGKKLWRKQIGETEWCLSAIPLGGYVKLLGEDGERQLTAEEQERSLNRAAFGSASLFSSGVRSLTSFSRSSSSWRSCSLANRK